MLNTGKSLYHSIMDHIQIATSSLIIVCVSLVVQKNEVSNMLFPWTTVLVITLRVLGLSLLLYVHNHKEFIQLDQ